MKYFFIVLGTICLIILAFIMLGSNLAALAHNIFYKTKRSFSWDPMRGWGI